MHTFFVKSAENFAPGDTVVLNDADDCFHIARSLRMAVGEKIKVSDGQSQYVCVLTSIHDKECRASVCELLGNIGEPPYHVRVFQGLPKGDKLETVIQKSTELGACEIIPFASEFCTVKAKDAASEDKKRQRRQLIAKEAAKQCGRTIVPQVLTTLTFNEMLSEASRSDIVLFCYESETQTTLKKVLSDIDMRGKNISVIVGSEGGFSEAEASRIVERGAHCISLGTRILRTESAALYVLSVLSCALEL